MGKLELRNWIPCGEGCRLISAHGVYEYSICSCRLDKLCLTPFPDWGI